MFAANARERFSGFTGWMMFTALAWLNSIFLKQVYSTNIKTWFDFRFKCLKRSLCKAKIIPIPRFKSSSRIQTRLELAASQGGCESSLFIFKMNFKHNYWRSKGRIRWIPAWKNAWIHSTTGHQNEIGLWTSFTLHSQHCWGNEYYASINLYKF